MHVCHMAVHYASGVRAACMLQCLLDCKMCRPDPATFLVLLFARLPRHIHMHHHNSLSSATRPCCSSICHRCAAHMCRLGARHITLQAHA